MNKDIQKQTLYWTNIKSYTSKHTHTHKKNLVEHSIDSCLPVPSFHSLILPEVPLHTQQEKAAKFLKEQMWTWRILSKCTKVLLKILSIGK